MTRVLDQIRDDVELEGYEPGTPVFDRVFIARRVEKCQEMQLVRECLDCKAFISCDLARRHMVNIKFGGSAQ